MFFVIHTPVFHVVSLLKFFPISYSLFFIQLGALSCSSMGENDSYVLGVFIFVIFVIVVIIFVLNF